MANLSNIAKEPRKIEKKKFKGDKFIGFYKKVVNFLARGRFITLAGVEFRLADKCVGGELNTVFFQK